MICKCGGMTRNHVYKTKDGISHYVHTCNGCGRRHEIKRTENNHEPISNKV